MKQSRSLKAAYFVGCLLALFPVAALADAAQEANPYGSLIMLGGFFAIFYFMLWRPQSKRAKEQRQMINNLAKGDEVVTTGGILGKVTKITDAFVVLALSEGVEVLVQKQAVAGCLPKGTIKAN
jgi:preprotein translocase subunit YajC